MPMLTWWSDAARVVQVLLDAGAVCCVWHAVLNPAYRTHLLNPLQGYLAHKKQPTSLGPP